MVPIALYPCLPCPYCNSTTLIIDEDSVSMRRLSGIALESYINKFQFPSLKEVESNESAWVKVLYGLVDFVDSLSCEPSQFIAYFKCKTCSESVSSIGLAKKPQKIDSICQAEIKVESFSPPLPMFPLASTTPSSVNAELLASFNSFHSDTCSSGNRLRRAMEKLCKELGYCERNLHRTIEAMSEKYPKQAELLIALKLVGNEASHSDGVDEQDLLDSYQVIEVVLDVFRQNVVEEIAKNSASRLKNKFKLD